MAQEIKKADAIKLHFIIKSYEGEIFSSYQHSNPLELELGKGILPQKLEDNIIGMKINESKSVSLSSDEAYGTYKKELVQEITRDRLPNNFIPEVGAELYVEKAEGQQIPVRIANVKENTVIIDGNHPLAGLDLEFELQPIGFTNANEDTQEQ